MTFETKITGIKKVKEGIWVEVTAGDYVERIVLPLNHADVAHIKSFAEQVKILKDKQLEVANIDMDSTAMKTILALKGKKLEEI